MPSPKLAVSNARNDTAGWPFSRERLLPASAHLNWSIIFSAAWPAVVFACVMLLPYLGKAFIVDDAWFMLQAQHVLHHPLQPTNFDICWFGNEQCGKSWTMASGQALGAYLMVPAILAGGAEWVAHLIVLLFAALAIVSMAAIALRLGWDRHHARLASLLLMATPPFLPAASSAMPDIPALALGLFGLERLLAWKTFGRPAAALAAALALGLTPFARPHYVAVVALAALLLADTPRLSALRELLHPARLTPVLGAAAVFAGTVWLARQGGGSLAPPAKMAGHQQFWWNLRAYLVYFVWPIPWAPLWIWRWRREKSLHLVALAAAASCAAILVRMKLADLWISGSFLLFLAAAALGAAALLHAWVWAARRRNALAALLLAWMLIPAPAVFYIHMPVRYFTVTVPACILLLLSVAGDLPRRKLILAAWTVIVVGALHSAAILYMDNYAAGMARTAARRLIAPRVAAGERVWWSGQWGLHWYAPQAGARESWPGKSGPSPGDLLVTGVLEGADHPLARFPHRTLVDSLSFACSCGRTLPPRGGLYTNLASPLLWQWGTDEVNRYEVWRIE